MKQTLVARINASLLAKAKAKAADSGKDLNEIVEQALTLYLQIDELVELDIATQPRPRNDR